MEYLTLGYIKDSFGLDGTLKIISSTSKGPYRYQKGNKVFLYNQKTEEIKELTVENYRNSNGLDFVKFLELYSKEDADQLKGMQIVVIKDQKDLNKDEYFYSDLEDCLVYDTNGKKLGKVIRVEEFPAQITLRVKESNGKEFFVPFVQAFIQKVDIENKAIFIEVIEGML